MRPSIAIAAVFVVVTAALSGCGEDDPAVCSSIDSLKESVESVKEIDVTSSDALSDLGAGLSAIEGDLKDVKDDAQTEFSSQIDAVETSYESVRSSVEAAKDDTSAATLAAAGTAISSFSNAVESLIDDVQSSC